jgi:nicotinate-nucleotide adenylyltransferase
VNGSAPRIGIMGGMFDPVHNGHVQLATRARAFCALDSVKLIPVGTPVHRDQSFATAAQRIAMLELACDACDAQEWMQVDARECSSAVPSYTYDTAATLRAEHPDAALFLLLGLDAFQAFDSWHRWRELFDLVHVLVAVRPGYAWESCRLARDFREEVARRLTTTADAAAQRTAGRVVRAALDLPDISSTQVRHKVRKGEDISALVPAAVAGYIAANNLYT